MSFNNGPYIFSDVPGYETSKGERIVKAFRKLWAKISRLEQAKIVEKITLSQEVQTSNHTDITINDVKHELLLTQLRYIIKIVREYANDKSSSSEDKACHEAANESNNTTSNPKVYAEQHREYQKGSLASSTACKMPASLSLKDKAFHEAANESSNLEVYAEQHHEYQKGSLPSSTACKMPAPLNSKDKAYHEATNHPNLTSSLSNYILNPKVLEQHHDYHKQNIPSSTVVKMSTTEPRVSHQEDREQNASAHQVTSATQTSNKTNASKPTERLPPDGWKSHYQSHYHLKLSDVPFILGASSSASHSVVANVQNIIALMKSHNKALCAPKPLRQRDACSAKADTQDTNKMIQKLSEDLSKLTKKQEKLKAMLDNAHSNPHSSHTKVKASQLCDYATSNNTDVIGQGSSTGTLQKNFKQSSLQKRSSANFGKQERHIVPTVRVQSNGNLQLARRKMLRSLKDFKTHLSEEDLSWN